VAKYHVDFFEKDDGTEPAKDFLESLDTKMFVKMARTITILSENGTQLREPYSKHLDDGIFELRAKVGSDITRVLYFFFVGRKIILTNGFVKKTQRTPASEINKAKLFRKEYIEREGT
jgi:Phage-related protein